ncbi:hypothetical protein CRM22_006460 [Opisthorchis felineus]|uniref:Lysophospholipid acyltransferase 5 n=1 Tax=Opisthorchis felineus TaxID=147828 RepID=A0A4S2LKU3_OPIFE|nr:hypothetical protein CRM22_006460 [Opisthorchis felineus]
MIPFDWLDIVASSVANTLQTDIIATRLLLSVLLGYPISIVYSLLSAKWSVPQRQLFLLLCGVFLFSWNFGLDIIHMFIGIFVTMFVNYMCFRTKLSVIFAFVFNMAYLLSGSYIYNRGTYDINWTTPYCILCLRLIGLTWDLFDASKPESERSAYQKQSALQTFPGVLETLSFCFVPTAFISGPQFPMRHYQSFVDGSLRPTAILANRSFTQRFIFNAKVQRTVIRFTMGLLGILILSKMLTLYPAEYMLTEEFQQRWSILSRFLYMVVFAQITLFRYVAIWLIGTGCFIDDSRVLCVERDSKHSHSTYLFVTAFHGLAGQVNSLFSDLLLDNLMSVSRKTWLHSSVDVTASADPMCTTPYQGKYFYVLNFCFTKLRLPLHCTFG